MTAASGPPPPTVESIQSYLDSLRASVVTFIMRDTGNGGGARRGGEVVADGAVFPSGRAVTHSRPDYVNDMTQTSVWDNLHHVRVQGRRDHLALESVPTGALVTALRGVLEVAANMPAEWQTEVVSAVADALVDEIPGERERRNAEGTW